MVNSKQLLQVRIDHFFYRAYRSASFQKICLCSSKCVYFTLTDDLRMKHLKVEHVYLLWVQLLKFYLFYSKKFTIPSIYKHTLPFKVCSCISIFITFKIEDVLGRIGTLTNPWNVGLIRYHKSFR